MLNIKIFLIIYLTIVTVNINIIATVAIVLLDLYFNATTSSKIIHFVLIITIPILTYISNFFPNYNLIYRPSTLIYIRF